MMNKLCHKKQREEERKNLIAGVKARRAEMQKIAAACGRSTQIQFHLIQFQAILTS